MTCKFTQVNTHSLIKVTDTIIVILYGHYCIIHALNHRAISKDITRLLEFLNKRPSAVVMPMDGMDLVTKSEHLLEQYLQSQVRPQ